MKTNLRKDHLIDISLHMVMMKIMILKKKFVKTLNQLNHKPKILAKLPDLVDLSDYYLNLIFNC
jgi:hypothetical protein